MKIKYPTKNRILFTLLIVLLTTALLLVGCAKPIPPSTPVSPPTPAPSPPPAKPASFTTTNLIITPAEVTSGSKATIQVTVTNLGELSGSYDVNLKIDDTVEATENVTLAGGASQNVTFALSKSIAKIYAVNVCELSGTFVVKSIPPPPVVTPPPAPAPAPPTFSGWGPVLWGSEFKATPGISTRTFKGQESKVQDGSANIVYMLYTTPQLPADNQVYYLWFKSGATTDLPRQLPGPYKSSTFGLVNEAGYAPPIVNVGHFAKGEAFEFAAVNNDKTRFSLHLVVFILS